MGGKPMRLDVERGNPSGVRPGVECLASARYESWLHRSRRHIYHCSPSSGFTLAGSFRRVCARAVGHTDRCYRGLGVLAVTRLRVDARERWFEGERWFGGDSAGAQAGQRITQAATRCAASRERYNNL
jgi:hypothetical protein